MNNFLDIVLEALNRPQFCRPFLVVAPVEIILDPLVLLLDLVLDAVQVLLVQFFLLDHQLLVDAPHGCDWDCLLNAEGW